MRTTFGMPQQLPASRFLADIPEELIDWRRVESSTESIRSGAGGWGSGGGSWGGSGGYGRGRNGPVRTTRRREEPATPSFDPAPARPAGDIPGFEIGDKVTHDSYGLGTVIGFEGSGSSAVAQVDFGGGQVKRLLLRYAPITKL